MKACSYCGLENSDDAVFCRECGTEFERPKAPIPPPSTSEEKPPGPRYEFTPLSAADRQNDWATLLTCGTLVEADLVASRLQAAGIPTFIPDQCLMQEIGWNFNTYGYVRVQVPPKNYEAARNLLA